MDGHSRAVLNLLLSFISSSPPVNHRDFYHAVRKARTKVNLGSLRSERGFTLFHETIAHRRWDLLQVFQQVAVFASLYKTPVSAGVSQYGGMTPTELAIHTNASQEREEMERLLKLERTLERDLMKQACRSGHVDRFKQLAAADPFKVGGAAENMTCLDWAITSGSKEMVEAVMEAERDVSHRRTSGNNLVSLVVTLGHVHLLELVRLHAPVDLNSMEVQGKTLLEKTAEFGDWEMFEAVRAAGAVTSDALLLTASAAGRLAFVQRFTRLVPEVNLNVRDARGKTPLYEAVQHGHQALAEFLLHKGVNVSLQDKRGRNVLHITAEKGNLELMNLLIRFAQENRQLLDLQTTKDKYLGSELCFLVRGRDRETLAWHYVHVDRASLEIFRRMTQGGAVDVAQYGRVIRSGWGANPSGEVSQEVEASFDMRKIGSDAEADMTPLHVAILRNNQACALRLIELADDVTTPDSFGLTPLHLASMRGNARCVSSILPHRRTAHLQGCRGPA